MRNVIVNPKSFFFFHKTYIKEDLNYYIELSKQVNENNKDYDKIIFISKLIT